MASTEISYLEPNTAYAVLGGEHDLASAEQLRDELERTLGTCSHLIIDLDRVSFIDSWMIRVLVATKELADARHRRFHLLLGTNANIERVLEITGMLPALNRVYTLEEALSDGPSPA